MQCGVRMKIFCRWLSLSSSSRTYNINLPRTSFPLSMKDNVAQKEVTIQEVITVIVLMSTVSALSYYSHFYKIQYFCAEICS